MRFVLAGWVALTAMSVWTCGIPDLKNEDKDAGTCRTQIDCSGCKTCQSVCTCVAAPDIGACIASCEADGGVGATGGSGGTGATGGSPDSSTSGGGASSGGGGAGATGGDGGTQTNGGSGGIPSSGGTGGIISGGGGTTGTPGKLTCNDQICNLTSSYCCYAAPEVACRSNLVDCSGTPVYCNGPTNCGLGKVCCGMLETPPSYYYKEVSCKDAIECPYEKGGRIFCTGDPSVCPVTLPCAPSGLLTDLSVCDSA